MNRTDALLAHLSRASDCRAPSTITSVAMCHIMFSGVRPNIQQTLSIKPQLTVSAKACWS